MHTVSESCITLWNDLYMLTGIPFVIAQTDGTVLNSFPPSLHEMLIPELFVFAGMEIEKHDPGNRVMMYFVNDDYYLILCLLDTSMYMISMPVSIYRAAPIPLNFVHHFVQPEQKTTFISFFNHTHSVFQSTRFANLVKRAYGSEPAGEAILFEHKRPEKKLQPAVPQKINLSSEYTEERSANVNPSIYFEKDIRKAVVSGDETACLRALNRPLTNDLGQMSTDSLQQHKYLFIITLYVLSHAAIEGGLDAEHAFHISDHYCQRLDHIQKVKDVRSLMITAAKDYCEQVRISQKIPLFTREVSACYNYILQHLYEPIQLKDLEAAVHMNRRSLTIHFKKETGMTIPQYITFKKLEEGRFLLKTTSLSILEISALLCFSSQSHFTKQFRVTFGITPQHYRDSPEDQ